MAMLRAIGYSHAAVDPVRRVKLVETASSHAGALMQSFQAIAITNELVNTLPYRRAPDECIGDAA
jgi:hypothetical protein